MSLNKIKNMEIVYQPKVTLATKEFNSFEALVRFFDENNNMLNTEEVIMSFMDVNNMRNITNNVIDKTISIMENLENYKKLSFSINISCVEIEDDFFEKWIEGLFFKYKEKYLKRLEFEITEKYKIKNSNLFEKRLKILKNNGFLISLDDICSGFNNYELMYKYEFDYIKIDKSLIKEINLNKGLIKNIIENAHKLNRKVIAEGIEDESTYRFLKELGCDLGQGFFFYKPKKISEFNI